VSSFSATIQLNNGTLTVARPYPSDEKVDELIDTLVYQVRDGDSGITGIGITITTADTPPPADTPAPSDGSASDTPVGDAAAKAAAKQTSS
jgi:hypothetical protein